MSARFVIDNSVVMSWCFGDEGNSYAEAVLESLETGGAFVPAIWPLEVGNVLLVAERKKRLSEGSVVRFLALLGGLQNRKLPRGCSRRAFRWLGSMDFRPMTLPTWTSPSWPEVRDSSSIFARR